MNNNELTKSAKLSIGDIVYTSWGYDQTNVSFFQIVGRTKCFAEVKQIESELVETGFMCGKIRPKKDVFVNENKPAIRRKIYVINGVEHSIMNVEFGSYDGYPYDGEPVSTSWYA